MLLNALIESQIMLPLSLPLEKEKDFCRCLQASNHRDCVVLINKRGDPRAVGSGFVQGHLGAVEAGSLRSANEQLSNKKHGTWRGGWVEEREHRRWCRGGREVV